VVFPNGDGCAFDEVDVAVTERHDEEHGLDLVLGQEIVEDNVGL
jgi:hypothetical protein